MKIFITGSTGFVGSHLVDRLLERGDTVYCLVRRKSNLQWLTNKPVRLVYGDLREELTADLRQALREVDYVYHVAGAIMGIRARDYFRVNADGTRNVLEALIKTGSAPKRFLLVSSLAAAGPGEDDIPVKESQSPQPVSWYGRSKLEAERIARTYEKHVPVTIVRFPPIYGPRDRGMLPVFRALKSGIILVLGKDTKTDFLYISDAIQGMILAAESAQSMGELYHVGVGKNLPAKESLKIMASAVGKKKITITIPIPLIYMAAALSEVKIKATRHPSIFNWQKMAELKQTNWMIDIGKATQHLGFVAQMNLEEGGRLTYEWYLERGWL